MSKRKSERANQAPLTTGEALHIAAVYTHGAPAGASAALLGASPLTPEQTRVWLAAPPAGRGDVIEPLRTALVLHQTLTHRVDARQRALQAADRWRAGEAFEQLYKSLAKLRWPAVNRVQIDEIHGRIDCCIQAAARLRCEADDSERCRRRRRLLQKLDRSFLPIKSWLALPDLVEAYTREGRPRDARRLREAVQNLLSPRVSQRRRRLLERLDRNLARLETPAPSLTELARSLGHFRSMLAPAPASPGLASLLESAEAMIDGRSHAFGDGDQAAWRERLEQTLRGVRRQGRKVAAHPNVQRAAALCFERIERFLERRKLETCVRRDLETLRRGPPPRIPATLWRRRLRQVRKVARRWFFAGLRITDRQVRSLMPLLNAEEWGALGDLLWELERLGATNYRSGSFEAARRVTERIAAWPAPAPSPEIMAAFLDACRDVEAAAVRGESRESGATLGERCPPDDPPPAIAANVAAMVAWVGSLRQFLCDRLACFGEAKRTGYCDFLAGRRFVVTPPAELDIDAILAWLIVLPASQRNAVIEFLQLGPVRPEVVEAALLIARAEAAMRRRPALDPDQLTDLAAAIALFDQRLAKDLYRDLFASRLSYREQKTFKRRWVEIRRRLRSPASAARERDRLCRCLHDGPAGLDPACFAPFASPSSAGGDRELAQRRALLALFHSYWRAGLVDQRAYHLLIDEHWRRARLRIDRFDDHCRRPSLAEMMVRFARQTQLAADRPLSVGSLVWAVWKYADADEGLAPWWGESIPSGFARRGRCRAPFPVETENAFEMIEHIRQRVIDFFDLRDIVAQANACWPRASLPHSSVSGEAEAQRRSFVAALTAIRPVELLLFHFFGSAGLWLRPEMHVFPLHLAACETLAALAPLVETAPSARLACNHLARLAEFFDPAHYRPWAAPLRFAPLGRSARQVSLDWNDLLQDLRMTAAAMTRAPRLAGGAIAAWSAVHKLLNSQQTRRRLALALRLAVDRDDPACRYVAATPALVAQIDSQRLGLSARGGRFHPGSEAAILDAKLSRRVDAVLAACPANSPARGRAELFVGECRRLTELHRETPPGPNVRDLTITCEKAIQERLRDLEADPFALAEPRLLPAARAAAASASDVVEALFVPFQAKGLRTLIPLRWGQSFERLEDALSRT